MAEYSTICAAALAMAEAGWPVFPCDRATKAPLTPHGFKDASRDPAAINAWWGRWPDAMIGVPTGAAIGCFVVDFDPYTSKTTGEMIDVGTLVRNLEEAAGCELPVTPTSNTPREGQHRFFGLPQGEPIKNRVRVIEGADVRGEGGFVIVPPSRRTDGKSYVWEVAPDFMARPQAPPELIALIRRTRRPEASNGKANSPVRQNAATSTTYGSAALTHEIAELAAAAEGTRNDSLNRAAFRLSQLIAGGHLHETEVRQALEGVFCSWPNRRKSAATMESGLAAGFQQPRIVANHRVLLRNSDSSIEQKADQYPELGLREVEQRRFHAELWSFDLTDLGNAERFAARMVDRLIFVEGRGWFAFDGICWKHDAAGMIALLAAQYVARSIEQEAEFLRGTEDDEVVEVKFRGTKYEKEIRRSDRLAAWRVQSEDNRHLFATLKQAQPRMRISAAMLDADPYKINARNGTLILSRSIADADPIEFRPHNPKDYLTQVLGADYDPAAECPIYDAFLKRVQPSQDVRRFLHQWGGYNLTGDVSEQKLSFWLGKGRNGKSTMIELLAAVAGTYACSIPVEALLDVGKPRSAGQATPELAMLVGKRLVYTDEPPKNARFAENQAKLLTGGDTMRVRGLHKDYVDFKPVLKLTLSGNHRLKIDGGEASHGTWRRFILVAWPVTIPMEERDKNLPIKLQAELSGILNRLLDGLRDWSENGLTIPDEINRVTEEYRSDSDPLGRFLEECTEPVADAATSVGDMYAVFVAWALDAGEKTWTKKGLSSALIERDYRQGRGKRRVWMGLRLTKSAIDFRGLDEGGGEQDRAIDDEDPEHLKL